MFERYEKHIEPFGQLRSLKYRFKAQFGADASQPFDDLTGVLNEIFIAARMLGQVYWRDQGHRAWSSEEEFQRHLADMHRHEAVFWEMSAKDDEIGPRVDKAVTSIEATCSDLIGQEPRRGLSWLIPLKLPRLRGSATRSRDRAITLPKDHDS